MSEKKGYLKIVNKKSSRKEKKSELIIEGLGKIKIDISNKILTLTQGDISMTEIINTLLDEVGLKRASKKKLNFLQFLHFYDRGVIRDAIGDFLFDALERYDSIKGSKYKFFMGVLKNHNERSMKNNIDEQENVMVVKNFLSSIREKNET